MVDRLRAEHGFTRGHTLVKDDVRERERRGREMFVPLARLPGHAQGDLGAALVIVGGVEQEAHVFVMDLPHEPRLPCPRFSGGDGRGAWTMSGSWPG